ncbi:MAG: hypothetical protein ABL879_09265 [Devosia sp.]
MIRHISIAGFALLLAASPALAGEYKGPATFSWTYAPVVLEVLPGQYSSAGQAKGTMVRPDTAPPELIGMAEICNNIDMPDGLSHGTCMIYDAGGDHYSVDYTCGVPLETPPAGAILACEGTATILGGTGKFAKIKGSGTFLQIVTGVLPDGTYVGYSTDSQDFTY